MSIQHKVRPNLDDRGFTERNGDGAIYADFMARWRIEPAWRVLARRLVERVRELRWTSPERQWARAARAEYLRAKQKA